MHYESQLETFTQKFIGIIEGVESILLTTCKSDGDAIASLLSLYTYLAQKYPYKQFKMAVCSYKNQRWNHLRYHEDIVFIDTLKDHFSNFKLIIFVDSTEYHRFGITQTECATVGVKTVAIDHHIHLSQSYTFDLSLVAPEATSTAELVYYTFLSKELRMDSHLAETLLVGIFDDTSTLRYMKPKQAYIYALVQNLIMEQHIDLGALLFPSTTCSPRAFRVVQELIRLTQLYQTPLPPGSGSPFPPGSGSPNWPHYSATYLSRGFAEQGKYTDSEIGEGASYYLQHHGVAIQGATWGVAVYPLLNGDVRIKIRSQPKSVNTRAIVEFLGIGSGHRYASSGLYSGSSEAPLDPFLSFKKFQDWLLTHTYDHLGEKVIGVEHYL